MPAQRRAIAAAGALRLVPKSGSAITAVVVACGSPVTANLPAWSEAGVVAPDIFSLPAERLVIYGYRNVMAACDLGDATCWDCAWRHYIDMIGSNPARRLMGELQFWVRVIRSSARKPLRYFPCPCRHICHDECMAVATLAAAQRQDRATVELAGRHLLGTQDCKLLTELWLAANYFGAALQMEQLELYPVNSQVVESIVALDQRPAELSSKMKMH